MGVGQAQGQVELGRDQWTAGRNPEILDQAQRLESRKKEAQIREGHRAGAELQTIRALPHRLRGTGEYQVRLTLHQSGGRTLRSLVGFHLERLQDQVA